MEIDVEATAGILERLVERAEAGEEIILTIDGRQIARLIPTLIAPMSP